MKNRSAICVFTWFFIWGCLAGCVRQDYSYFMKIENYEVTKEEYSMLAYDHISEVALSYGSVQGMDVNAAGFWETKIGDRTPMDQVKEMTDEDVIRHKGIQILASEAGLIKDISYEDFLKQYQEELEQRKKQKEAQEPVYGPVTLSLQQYDSYRQSQLEQALLDFLQQEKVAVSEKELKRYYTTVAEKEGTKNYQADLSITSWAVDEAGTGREEQVDLVTIHTLELGKEDLVLDRIAEALKGIEEGEFTDEIALTWNRSGIIEVKRKEYVPFGTYEETKDYVEALYREEKANEYLEKRLEAMDCVWGEEYGELTYSDLVK